MSSDSGDYTYPAVQPFPERCKRRIDALEQQLAALVQRVKSLEERENLTIGILDTGFSVASQLNEKVKALEAAQATHSAAKE